MVQSFCCCHLWFGSSKIVISTVGIDKTQKSGHLFTILLRGSNAISQLYVRKDSSAPLHFQKASTPSVSARCVTEEFSLPCKEAFKAPQAVNTSRWSIRLQHAFIHPHLVLSWVSCPENLRVGNKTLISEKGRGQERSWLSDFWHYCTKLWKKVTILHKI